MVGGLSKAYNLTITYVLYELSYINLVMFSSVLPTYDDAKPEKRRLRGDVIDCDNPKNRNAIRNLIAEMDE